MRAARVLPVLLLLACSCAGDDPTSPGRRVPTTGRYAFTLSAQPGTLGIYRDAGTLVLTAATAEELTGRIASTGASFGPGQLPRTVAFTSIGWNLDAYVVIAVMPYGNYNLRLAGGRGDDLTCGGRLLVNRGSGALDSYPVTCTAIYQGP